MNYDIKSVIYIVHKFIFNFLDVCTYQLCSVNSEIELSISQSI